MKVHSHTDPFPFLFIEDLYTEEELRLIWCELDYYQSNKVVLESNTNPSVTDDGKSRTEKKGCFIDNIFENRDYSSILNVSRKLFDPGLICQSNHIFAWKHFQPNVDHTLLSYYDDGCYYLVTPVEKIMLQVEDKPFVVKTFNKEIIDGNEVYLFQTNVDEVVTLSKKNPLRVEIDDKTQEPSPYLLVRKNLEALISRNVFYQLVEEASLNSENNNLEIFSNNDVFSLGKII